MQFGVMWCCFEAKWSLEWFLLKIGPPRKPAIRGAKPSACGHTLISSASGGGALGGFFCLRGAVEVATAENFALGSLL